MKEIIPPYLVEGYEQTGSYTDEDEADEKVFLQLRELGSNFSRPRHCVHYFYFPSEQQATDASTDLFAMEFEVRIGDCIETEPESRHWPVIAERTEVINPEVIRSLRTPLRQIGERHGGEYDGWEAQAG